MPGIAKRNKHLILKRLAQGHYLPDIASDIGSWMSNISRAFASHHDYRQARKTGAEQRILNLLTGKVARGRIEPMHWQIMRYKDSFGMAAWDEFAARLKRERFSSSGKK